MVTFDKSESMNLMDFYQRFPDEDNCIVYLKSMRLKQGISCKNATTKTSIGNRIG
jgi:hypothetical protein